MAIRKCCIGLVIVGMFVIGRWLPGSAPQAAAETLNYKAFNHVTKVDLVPIADVEGHVVGVQVRDGVSVFENGEWAWHKATILLNLIKGAGTYDHYVTYTFLDGSTITTHTKGPIEATPAGVASASKSTGDIVHGTGRFQGIKGTHTVSSKILPTEKGELGPKSFAEGTMVYTLPGK